MVERYIIKKHMTPVLYGKSYYLSSNVNEIENMILQTVKYPDLTRPHWDGSGKIVYFKKFPKVIGIHGMKRTYCKRMVVVVRNFNNEIITAYPTDEGMKGRRDERMKGRRDEGTKG